MAARQLLYSILAHTPQGVQQVALEETLAGALVTVEAYKEQSPNVQYEIVGPGGPVET